MQAGLETSGSDERGVSGRDPRPSALKTSVPLPVTVRAGGDHLCGQHSERPVLVAGALPEQCERLVVVDVEPGGQGALGLLDHHATVQRDLELLGQQVTVAVLARCWSGSPIVATSAIACATGMHTWDVDRRAPGCRPAGSSPRSRWPRSLIGSASARHGTLPRRRRGAYRGHRESSAPSRRSARTSGEPVPDSSQGRGPSLVLDLRTTPRIRAFSLEAATTRSLRPC